MKAIGTPPSVPVFTDLQEYVGIDKVVITYALDPDWNDGSSPYLKKHRYLTLPNGTTSLMGEGLFPTSSADIHLRIYQSGHAARLDFNPSRWRDSNGTTLCPVGAINEAITWAIEELVDTCRPRWSVDPNTGLTLDSANWPKGWESEVKLHELHVTRDFYVPESSFGVHSMLSVDKKQYPRDFIYRYRGKPQTITWGKRQTARVSFYDKSEKHRLESGWYRFEVQAHGSVLKSYGISKLDAWNPESAISILCDKWLQARFDEPLSIQSGLAELVEEMKKSLHPQKVASIIGNAFLESNGLNSGMSQRHLQEGKKALRRLGILNGLDLQSIGISKVFLNLLSGRLEKYVPL
jgi:hypothetical protein